MVSSQRFYLEPAMFYSSVVNPLQVSADGQHKPLYIGLTSLRKNAFSSFSRDESLDLKKKVICNYETNTHLYFFCSHSIK